MSWNRYSNWPQVSLNLIIVTNRGAEANPGGGCCWSLRQGRQATRAEAMEVADLWTTNDPYLAHTMHIYKSVRAVDII